MCTINNKAELERKIEELRKYKAMAEEATSIEKALEHEISSYMEDNNLTEEYTDSAKISYKEQERKTLDKKRLEEDLGDLKKFIEIWQTKPSIQVLIYGLRICSKVEFLQNSLFRRIKL